MITASNLVYSINQLPKNRTYNYINPKTRGVIKIINIQLPEGPIIIKRYNPIRGETANVAKTESISLQMIWRVANSIQENQPINLDRILGASYNTRSVLESLLAHTPEFYYCYPGRIESINSRIQTKHGHKHLLWLPNKPHEQGVLHSINTDIVISEIPSFEVFYDSLTLPQSDTQGKIDIEVSRRHAQIQIALLMIGKQLQYRVWIAQNDKAITYQNRKLGEYEGVIFSLNNENLLQAYSEAIKAASFIDCIWFKNSKLMPAVIEIEDTTGVTSGLTRMKKFQDCFPPFPTRYVIVSPDDDRSKVINESNKEMFRSLDAKYFPYSSVEELYALCQRRKLRGINEEFLDCYMEKTLN
jgi:hypothetical protein